VISAASILFWISLAGLVVLALLGFRESKSIGRLIFWLAALALCGGIYFFLFQKAYDLQPKGAQPNQTAFVIVLYLCMVAGMACHYFYAIFLLPKRKRPSFDLGGLLAPMFASPLVFIPLLGSFQNTEVDLAQLTLPKFMVFLVAFENGFFWKEVFENRRKEQKQ
jgi:hypothetical protein